MAKIEHKTVEEGVHWVLTHSSVTLVTIVLAIVNMAFWICEWQKKKSNVLRFPCQHEINMIYTWQNFVDDKHEVILCDVNVEAVRLVPV